MKIFKYQLPIAQTRESVFIHRIPKGGKFLAVQVQYDIPCVWFLVSPGIEEEERKFEIIGTGIDCEVTPEDRYLGTFQLFEGTFVGHLFETTRR